MWVKRCNEKLWVRTFSLIDGLSWLSWLISGKQAENLSVGKTKSYRTNNKTTVENLDKDSNADKGKNVFFTCTISSFVKDDSGNTAGANVRGTDTSSFTFIQVGFPANTDITKLNTGDTLQVWGTDQGVFSGKNGFGATIQEVEVTALYMMDVTSSYNTP